MKKTILLLACLFFIKFANAQTDSAKLMLQHFYKTYITAINNSDDKLISATQHKYVTAKVLKQLDAPDLDYDPFINAQDVDMDWLRTLNIVKDSKDPQLYIVSFVDNYEKKRHYVKVLVVRQKDQYKINGFK